MQIASTSGAMTNSLARSLVASLNIGVGPGGTSYYLNGLLGEIIVFDRGLKNAERQDVEKYLEKKWGIKIS